MGLKSAKHGVKAQLRARFPEAFREFETLAQARDASQASRAETISIIDGNVLMMSVPKSACTVDDFVGIVTNNLKRAIATCKLTLVVFDEPEHITEAKKEEQRRRDAARQATAVVCSSDVASTVPTSDDYNKAAVERLPDVHVLVSNRGTRNRFFDEIMVRVLHNLESQNTRWRLAGFEVGDILFDGLDERGADRPKSEERLPRIFGTNSSLPPLFLRDVPIGEGDLKLADIGRKVRSLAKDESSSLKGVKLNLATTIDTDSLAIESIEEAKRTAEPASNFNTVICMRERAKKRDSDGEMVSYYLCVDVSMLHALLQKHMFGMNTQPSPMDQRAAITLMAAGWALCGCDFVELKSMRADVVLESMPTVVKLHNRVLQNMHAAWSGKREELHMLEKPIKCLLSLCAMRLSELPRTNKQLVEGVRSPDVIPIRRASWVGAYWNSVEFKDNMDQFGFVSDTSL